MWQQSHNTIEFTTIIHTWLYDWNWSNAIAAIWYYLSLIVIFSGCFFSLIVSIIRSFVAWLLACLSCSAYINSQCAYYYKPARFKSTENFFQSLANLSFAFVSVHLFAYRTKSMHDNDLIVLVFKLKIHRIIVLNVNTGHFRRNNMK